ncbi:hypothetical protein FXF61_00515 [Pseudomonas sp. C27(2019)]|uniref:hypothetical protein n=1 Tax=Pseudomonas sp. C27(2019) TaxID=2604941 RepID=UPI001248F0ED|nr:hypothetical protein [Pseudomonas sp. C27(2019)]QEY57754.1 hypothetical protein FXF61_00515 [Pseudomonas sp. C27(2019)]
MEAKAQGLGYRVGSGFKRLRSFIKNHESRLVRKAGQSYPKYGVLLARLLFLSIKIGLVILAIASLAVAVYIALMALIVAVVAMLLSRRSERGSDWRDEIYNQGRDANGYDSLEQFYANGD